MITVVIGTIVIIGLLGLWAYYDIAKQPTDAEINAQCTPSRPRLLRVDRPGYQEHQPRRYRWHGLERSIKEKVEVNDDRK